LKRWAKKTSSRTWAPPIVNLGTAVAGIKGMIATGEGTTLRIGELKAMLALAGGDLDQALTWCSVC
jgi:hypothetical protein